MTKSTAKQTAQDLRDRQAFFNGTPQSTVKPKRKTVGVKRVHPYAVIPVKSHATDAGFDLVAIEDVIIEPGETVKVPTGLAFELPEGYEMQIRPRSGVTTKTKLRVQLGTVDAGYRGEVSVIVDNIAPKDETSYYLHLLDGEVASIENGDDEPPYGTYLIRKGDRIAQAVIQRLPDVVLSEVSELDESDRGVGGFGSTGV